MNLYDYVRGLSPERNIKIGSQVCYFYVGTAGDFCANVDDYSKAIKKKLRDDIDEKKREITKIKNETTVQEYLRMTDMPDMDSYATWVEHRFNLICHRKEALAKAEGLWANYIPLRIRKIKETFTSSAEDSVTAIQVEGDENGKFWTISEAKELPALAITKGKETD